MKYFFTLILAFFINGCITSSDSLIEESTVSLTETRKTIVKLYGEPRSISQNGRELITQYLDKKGRVVAYSKKNKERRYAHITILGERRPYDISIVVPIETEVQPGVFERSSENDEKLAEQIAKDLKNELLKSQENRNIIDDFKAF